MASQNAKIDPGTRARTLLAVNSSGEIRRLLVDSNDYLQTTATINTGDIEIGAVEIKNATSDDRVIVSAGGELSVLDTNSAALLVSAQAINTDTAAINATLSSISSAGIPINAALPTGTNTIGKVNIENNIYTAVLDLTVDTGIYAAGDSLVTNAVEIDNAALEFNGSGIIKSVVLVDQAMQNAEIDLIFFESNPSSTTFTANSALDVADADNDMIIDKITVNPGDYVSFADNSMAKLNLNSKYRCVGERKLWLAGVVRGTPTYAAAGDLRLKIIFERDK